MDPLFDIDSEDMIIYLIALYPLMILCGVMLAIYIINEDIKYNN